MSNEREDAISKVLQELLREAEFVGEAKAPFSTWVAAKCRAALASLPSLPVAPTRLSDDVENDRFVPFDTPVALPAQVRAAAQEIAFRYFGAYPEKAEPKLEAIILKHVSSPAEQMVAVSAEWLIRKHDDTIDHACAECLVGYDNSTVRAGFQCYYHQAKAAMQSVEVK